MRKNFFLALMALGCSNTFEPDADYYELRVPPEFFRNQFEWVRENCVFTSKQFSSLTHYIVRAEKFNGERRGTVDDNRIFLTEDALLGESLLLTHEYLHVHLGTNEHPPIFGVCESLFNRR